MMRRVEAERRAAPARRDILAGGLAAAGATVLAGRPAAAAPAGLTVGAIEITTVSDGTLTVPLSFSLPETPRGEVEALLTSAGMPAGGGPTPTNVSLVRTGRELVLVDAGSGGRYQDTAGRLVDNLAALGVQPEEVTRIVLTHGHADHLWGLVDDLDDSLRFPNALYVVPAVEWDFWTRTATEDLPDWLRPMAPGSARTLRAIDGKVERRGPGETVAPGLSYLATPGHTPGHMSVLVESDGQAAVIGGDALSHPAVSFQRPDWPFGSDLDRELAARTRRSLLDRLATDRLPLVGFHLPGPAIGRVERQGTAYRFVPA